ncbi:Mss4-like protein, partial [Pyrenochaeta sp. MPI-SDFR-AT-0127]
SCHCRAATHAFAVPLSSLPLSTHLCSCDISRRISGSLLTSYINITHPTPSSPDPPKPNTSKLIAYNSSSILKRWFCNTCGTHMYLEYAHDGHFEAATGTLQSESLDGIVEVQSCMWIEDTKDGGASRFIREIGGKEVKRWAQEAGKSEEVELDWQSTHPAGTGGDTKRGTKKEEKGRTAVYAHCHCRGVSFWITHPNEASKNAGSPWPDLVIPDYLHQSQNPKNHPWWTPGGNKFLAGTCTCHSCRRASGFDITFWSFIPTVNIFLDSALTQSFPPSGHWGTMQTYTSSPGVTRTFCTTCGANVFWSGSEETHGRRDLIDVAVGLLDASSGARAEELLAWWPGRVSFREDA